MTILLAYLFTAAAFLALDLIWLGVVAKDFYAARLGELLSVSLPAALLFYVVYIAGVIFFAVAPALEAQSLAKAALLGALFGFFCYGTYDLTNLATLKGYPASLAFVDLAWGTVLTGASAAAGYWLTGLVR